MASYSQNLFGDAVKQVLNNWSALQLAVEHHHGSRETADSMAFVIETAFIENDVVDSYSIEDFLQDIFTTKFHLQVEDNSFQQVSERICLLFRMCQENKVAEVQRFLAELAMQHCRWRDDEMIDGLDHLEEESTVSPNRTSFSSQQHAPSASSQPTATSDDNMEVSEEITDPDGWQVICRGRRR